VWLALSMVGGCGVGDGRRERHAGRYMVDRELRTPYCGRACCLAMRRRASSEVHQNGSRLTWETG